MPTNPLGVTSGGYVLYIAKETSWGVPPTSAAGYVMLPADPISGFDDVTAITDDLRRGQNIIGFNRMEGIHKTALALVTLAYPDQIGNFYNGIMGQDVVSGSGPYLHTFDIISDSAATATPSYAVSMKDDVLISGSTLIHGGCKVTSLTTKFDMSQGFVGVDIALEGKGAQTATLAGVSGTWPTSEPSSNNPLRGWEAYITNGTGEINGKLLHGDIVIARAAEAIYAAGSTANPNAKYADSIIHGMVGITGSLVAVFDNTNLMDLYRNFPTTNLLIGFDNNVSGVGHRILEFDVKKATFGEAPAALDHSTDAISIAFSFRGLYDSVTSKGLTVRLTNAHSATY
jgi:Phage tail tube protein